jgi:hypothetical protein
MRKAITFVLMDFDLDDPTKPYKMVLRIAKPLSKGY